MCLPMRYDKVADSSPNTKKKTIRKRGVYIVVVHSYPWGGDTRAASGT